MKNQIGLGDFLQELLSKLNLAIKDQELLDSLNDSRLHCTPGLELIYPKDKPFEMPAISKVDANEILKEVNEKEVIFEKFWNLYNKKTNRVKVEAKFLRCSVSEINKIMETLPYYIKYTPDVKFRKDPITYLNQRTWEDEIYLPRVIQTKENPFKF